MKPDENLERLQLLEQNLQQYANQKQQYQLQLAEVESALKELANAETCYKIVGNIMVMSPRDELEKDLNSKKEMFELRIKTFEKQEARLKEKAQALQKEVLKRMRVGENESGTAGHN